MGLHLAPTYWVVAGVAVCLRLAPVRGTTAFGAANTLALAVLAGPAVAVAGLTLATGLWALPGAGGRGTVVAVYRARLRDAGGRRSSVTRRPATGRSCGTAIPTAGPLPEAFWLLVALSFSYVFLRSLDATRAVLAKGSPLLDPLGLAGYLFPFHMLLAGPVAAYDQHSG